MVAELSSHWLERFPSQADTAFSPTLLSKHLQLLPWHLCDLSSTLPLLGWPPKTLGDDDEVPNSTPISLPCTLADRAGFILVHICQQWHQFHHVMPNHEIADRLRDLWIMKTEEPPFDWLESEEGNSVSTYLDRLHTEERPHPIHTHTRKKNK